jgi:hypothetical protein
LKSTMKPVTEKICPFNFSVIGFLVTRNVQKLRAPLCGDFKRDL